MFSFHLQNKIGALILLVLISLTANGARSKVNLQNLLELSDRSRGALTKGSTWQLNIESTEDNEKSSRSFQIKSSGNDAFAEAISPARNQGEVFLFKGNDMWFSKPGLKKPLSISSRQRLSGQIASGDIASTHYSRDYSATLEREELVSGEKTWCLLLKARNKKTTYDQIRYWISQKTNLGIKAEFLSLQGKVLKTAHMEYLNSIQSDGKTQPFVSRLEIVDFKNKSNKSVLTYLSPKEEKISPHQFQVDNLQSL